MSDYLGGTQQFTYGTRKIDYELIYQDRETLAIHVYPDCSVVVEAPLDTTDDAIRAKLRKRAKWIVKQQRTFKTYETRDPQRQYVSGETHYYLGKRYRLRVLESEHERVQFSRGRLILQVSDTDDWQGKQKLMQDWYKSRAKFVFKDRLVACHKRFVGVDIPFPEFQIRAMKSQWGSCTPSGKIILNIKLIQLPKKFIDYVIIHELCHLKEHKHNRIFYDLLTRILPEWETLREEMNQFDFT